MKRIVGVVLGISLFWACQEREPIFEKSADERAAEAIANLKDRLAAPPNGWLLRYKPTQESGSYVVLLNFDNEDNLRIRTDFGVNENEFFDQSITYRVDNSLGLELIFETYSFFSFLAELGNASFLAEFEFDYVNETPDGDLVFRSKTDPGIPSTLVFQPAPDNAESLLGRTVNANLESLSESLGVVSPVYRLNYANRDLSLFLSLNTFLRTINFTSASTQTGERTQAVNFSTGYTAQGNSIVLDEPLVGNFINNEVNIPAINLQNLVNTSPIEACDQVVDIQQYQGTIAESNESVALLPTLFDPSGASFQSTSNIFITGSLTSFYQNGVSVGGQVAEQVEGASIFVIYYINNDQNTFLAMGYLLELPDGNFTIPVREFTPTYTGNQVQFEFAPEYSIANGDTTAVLDTAAMDIYINNLTEGGQTRILQTGANVYEFYNPCTGWSVVLQGIN